MTAMWQYCVLFSNSFLSFGGYYFIQVPIGLQNDVLYSYHQSNGLNTTERHVNCSLCLGLGELRYNLLLSIARWCSVLVCAPLGILIDRLGNACSALLFNSLVFLGSILFCIGSMSHVPANLPAYMMLTVGYSLVTLADGPVRFVQARVIACCFPDSTLVGVALATFGISGQAVSMFATPNIVKAVGPMFAMWIGVSFCGFGMLCAAGLAFLLRYKAQDGIESKHIIGLMTLSEMKKMPVTYWLHTTGLAFAAACWICKQDNLPDYLEWRYGYTMTEASYITGTSAMMFILSPFFTIVLKKFDCDGVMVTLVSILMIPLYVLLGFCQSVNVYAIALLDGTFCSLFSLLAMQITVMLCPANYVGTLSGVLYFVRNIIVALAFVAAGYILEKHSLTNLTKTMDGYKNFFLMAIAMSSVASVLW